MHRLSILMLALAAVATLVASSGCGGDEPGVRTTLTPGTGSSGTYIPPTGSPGSSASPAPSGSPVTISPSATPTTAVTPGQISDEKLRRLILKQWSASPVLTGVSDRLTITVKNAHVYIGGVVPKSEQKQTAEQIAVNTPGVRDVVSTIRVKAVTTY
jgi:hypothetical protein